VDVATQSTIRVQYRVLHNLDRGLFAPVLALTAGYHDLASSPASGALDYVRSPLLAGTTIGDVMSRSELAAIPWTDSDGDNAIAALQAEVRQSVRLFVFGEQFTTGLGQHNVHMNQGDPAISPDGHDHQVDDGIWQDGGTIVERVDQTLHAVLTKFSSQSLQTDDHGLPV